MEYNKEELAKIWLDESVKEEEIRKKVQD